MRVRNLVARTFLAGAALLLLAARASPQDNPPVHDHASMSAAPGWTWASDGNVFFGYNYQLRQFLDYSAWESQNWFMGGGERAVGRGRLTLQAMLSLEPFTLGAKGSPQLFQTGETYNRLPIVNYQHPHDLLMGLGATYQVTAGRLGYVFGADLVGSPTLGPTAFMHRESARGNPQVPLTHHFLDSTHISAGVIRGGVVSGPLTLEASVFRGAEPNEDRIQIEPPKLDSWAARAQFRRGPWHAQVSGGHLAQPEWYEPFDQARITASLSFEGEVRTRPLKMTAAWGQNRELSDLPNGTTNGYLFEGEWDATRSSSLYGRFEVAQKEVIGLEVFIPGVPLHPHFPQLVQAGTAGYVRRLLTSRAGTFGVGADITFYGMPPVLTPFWGSSRSYHVFLRWRAPTTIVHQH